MPVPVLDEVQDVVPVSEVVPLARVKSSSQKVVAVGVPDVTVTCLEAVHPVAGFLTVTVYVPAAVTVGFCAVLVKLLGPVQL